MKEETKKMNEEIIARKLKCQFEEIFQKGPFNIILKINNIKKIDRALTQQHNIYIYDNRICKNNELYKNMSPLELESYRTRINVKRNGRRCITIRNVLNAMLKDEHYNNEYVKLDKHNNLMTLIDITDDLTYFIAIFE